MKVTRFCSQHELDKYLAGETLTNDTDHYRGGKGGSTSVGFCFTTDEPHAAWRYLKGIVTAEVCIVIDIDKKCLTKSSGKYADWSDGIGYKSCLKTEYCTRQYSQQNSRLLKVIDITEIATSEEIAVTKLLETFKIDELYEN